MFETILLPVDGSEDATAAAHRGFDIARAHGSHVHVVCVADTGPLGDYQLPGEETSAAEALGGRAERVVESVLESVPTDDIEVTAATPTGPAKETILDYAEDVGADLIVMGTRGRDGVERLMLGSVTEHVVRRSDVDVLVHGGLD